MGKVLPDFSILVPSLGQPDYLRLFLKSLRDTHRHRYEVLIHIYPRGNIVSFGGYPFPVIISAGDEPGMGVASNIGLEKARGEWIIWLGDDMVFLPGWDEFVGRIQEDRILCWDLLEPYPGSFPPPCPAGTEPGDFNFELAAYEASRRAYPRATPGNFFGTFIFHRSLLTPKIRWPETTFQATADIDLPYLLYLVHPNIVFGRLGRCIYHFTKASIRHHPELQRSGDEVQQQFVSRFGITTGEAYRRLEERSLALWT